MAKIYPDWNVIDRLRVKVEEGERFLLEFLERNLDDSFDIFFNPYLDGDRPDVVILKKHCGVIIIEVKDWNLSYYSVNQNNKWLVDNSIIRSPHQQVFRYKANMFELHIPILGVKEISNKNFYNVIDVFVYFHNANDNDLISLYHNPLNIIKTSWDNLNQERSNYSQEEYERRINLLSMHKRQINRDKNISICRDNMDKKINSIKRLKKNNIFDDDIYNDFKRRLLPPSHVQQQGINISFDNKQLPITISKPGLSKIKGVAGCGKTSILAQRTLNAWNRTNSHILILTYNITIRHYIKDVLSRLSGKALPNEIEIIHYHGFINSKMNEHGIDVKEMAAGHLGTNSDKINAIYSSVDLFDNKKTSRYKTIFIDEVQDYEPNWIKLIKKSFLDQQDGEMVLFCDQSQNIYEREINQRESPIIQGFGNWKTLTKSYRYNIDSPLIAMFFEFQKEFILAKYLNADIFETKPTQLGMNYDIVACEASESEYDYSLILKTIRNYIKSNELHPNDVVIIASEVEPLFRINNELSIIEKTQIMFETEDEVTAICTKNTQERNSEIEKIRRRKKSFFFQNSGLIKLSTIHSFKGMESETVFFIVNPNDSSELVYTGITRSKKNLIIFDRTNSKFNDFFKKNTSYNIL